MDRIEHWDELRGHRRAKSVILSTILIFSSVRKVLICLGAYTIFDRSIPCEIVCCPL